MRKTTKNGDPLILPMSDYLHNLLRERKQSAGSSPWVFPGNGPAGHIVEPKKFSQRVAAASGVTFTLDDLRRTYITIQNKFEFILFFIANSADNFLIFLNYECH